MHNYLFVSILILGLLIITLFFLLRFKKPNDFISVNQMQKAVFKNPNTNPIHQYISQIEGMPFHYIDKEKINELYSFHFPEIVESLETEKSTNKSISVTADVAQVAQAAGGHSNGFKETSKVKFLDVPLPEMFRKIQIVLNNKNHLIYYNSVVDEKSIELSELSTRLRLLEKHYQIRIEEFLQHCHKTISFSLLNDVQTYNGKYIIFRGEFKIEKENNTTYRFILNNINLVQISFHVKESDIEARFSHQYLSAHGGSLDLYVFGVFWRKTEIEATVSCLTIIPFAIL